MRTGLIVAVALVISALGMASIAMAVDKPAPTTAPAAGVTAGQVKAMLDTPTMFARWACVLAGLALAAVIWVGWSMRTLAQNQVALAKLIARKAEEG